MRRRIQAADRSLTAAAKEARKAIRKEADESNEQLEGQLYDPGIANKDKIEILLLYINKTLNAFFKVSWCT